MAKSNGAGKIPSNVPDQAAAANIAARNAILLRGVDRWQQVYSQGIDPASQTVLNINPSNVGLIRGFLVKVSGTLHNSGGGTANRTGMGASNLLRGVSFTDLNNQSRIQTQGWHLSMINSAKQPMVIGGAYAPNIPVAYGNNYDVMTAPATIATNTDAAVQFYYYVPLSYTKTDLRGAMYAGVVNAVATLQLEINPNPFTAAGDPSLAVYSGQTGLWKAGSLVTVTVWQDYIDQLPMDDQNNAILPQQDLATLYQLQNTALTGLVAGQDYGVPFANFRNFLSTVIGYDNGGTFNAGTDINYFALQTANSSNIWKYGPEEAAFFDRATFMADPPSGYYYFDHRIKPISTQQFGNTQITVNPITVGANSALLVGYEYFAQASQVVFAGSLPSGG